MKISEFRFNSLQEESQKSTLGTVVFNFFIQIYYSVIVFNFYFVKIVGGPFQFKVIGDFSFVHSYYKGFESLTAKNRPSQVNHQRVQTATSLGEWAILPQSLWMLEQYPCSALTRNSVDFWRLNPEPSSEWQGMR